MWLEGCGSSSTLLFEDATFEVSEQVQCSTLIAILLLRCVVSVSKLNKFVPEPSSVTTQNSS